MKFNHIGIPTTANFEGEIDLPHLKITVSDHEDNPFGIQWQRYWEDAPYPDLVKLVPHVAFEAEFGVTAQAWAQRPIDPETAAVMNDGLRILYDPEGRLKSALAYAESLGPTS
jgi:hypothetical protein